MNNCAYNLTCGFFVDCGLMTIYQLTVIPSNKIHKDIKSSGLIVYPLWNCHYYIHTPNRVNTILHKLLIVFKNRESCLDSETSEQFRM